MRSKAILDPPVASAAATAMPAGCSSLKLRQLSRRVSQHFDHIVGEAGLKTTQYSLCLLYTSPSPRD